MRQLLEQLLPLIVLMVILGGAALWVFIKSNTHPFFKFLLIPLVLFIMIAIPVRFTALMGYSVWLKPPKEFLVLSHVNVIKDGKKAAIEMWIIDEENNRTRVYIVPYSKKLERQLNEIRNSREKGMEGRLMRQSRSSISSRDDDESGYQVDIRLPAMPSKEMNHEQRN